MADVGCDHGLLSAYLITEGLADHAFALDINSSPLEHARENAERYGAEDKMEFILSDGLSGLPGPYAETVIIMGMGGSLIGNIIDSAPPEVLSAVKRMVLGPQSEVDIFRRKLRDRGFIITDEKHIFEDGKYYPVMLAEPEDSLTKEKIGECRLRNKTEYTYGRLGLERQDKVLKGKIERDKENYLDILSGELPLKRRRELEGLLNITFEALANYDEDF